MFCWTQTCSVWEHMMFGKDIDITQQTVDNTVTLVHLATLCWALLTLVLIGNCWSLLALTSVERNTPRNFWWCSSDFLVLSQTRDAWQSLAVSSESNCHCWFMSGVCKWIELPLLLIRVNWQGKQNHPKRTISKQPTSSFALLTFPFHCLWWVVG